MADIMVVTEELRAEWAAWVAERPDNVRAVAEHFFPWKLYRMKSTGQRVTLLSFGEHDDGSVSVRVNVGGRFNFVAFERQVFGIDPNDLEECDLPATGELLGSAEVPIEVARDFVEAKRKADN